LAGVRLSYRARKRLALLALAVGLPLYIVAAVTIVGRFERPGILTELLIYLVLGIIWALPLRAIFRGVGKAEPGAGGGEEGDRR
jgi:Protein of unknown function (DUF2842)